MKSKLTATVAAISIVLTGCAATPDIEPAPSTSPTGPASPLSFENLDSYWVSRVAWEISGEQISKAKHVDLNVKYQLGPKLDPAFAEPMKQDIQKAADVIGEYYVPDVYYANYFSAQDGDWVDGAIEKSGSDVLSTPTRQRWSEFVKDNATSCRTASAGMGTKGPFINRCLDGYTEAVDEISAHEYFHLLQSSTGNNRLPVWLTEGAATFYGMSIAPDRTKYDIDYRNDMIKEWTRYRIPEELAHSIAAQDTEVIHDAILRLTKPSAPDGELDNAYALGLLMSEALVAVSGWDTWIKLNMLPNRSVFKDEFEKLYGINIEDFYEVAAEYVASQHRVS